VLRRPHGRSQNDSGARHPGPGYSLFGLVVGDNIGQNAPAATLPNGEAGFVGLLPDCTETSTGPCHDRAADTTVADSKSPTNYDIVLVADVPASFAEDPHMS
jgi:hypothetical protein